jgi:HSP20 family protein
MRLIPYAKREPENSLDSLFNVFFDAPAAWTPRLDVKETDDAYVVQMDVPGIDKKDIHVTLEDGLLSVSGNRKAEHQEEGANGTWHRVERSWGSFERHLRLGDGVDADNVKAEAKDGVLTIRVPKKETAKPRVIAVE